MRLQSGTDYLTYLWQELEPTLTATGKYPRPYTDIEVWADFTHEEGQVLRRPAFWDGGQTWRVRFAAPREGTWTWQSFANVEDEGLVQIGRFKAQRDTEVTHRFYRHGFWKMSPQGRNLVHADGTPALLVADTAWALPWRATLEGCKHYAQDRQQKGFNAVLLMSVQSDMNAVGPRSREADKGFEVGFEDLPTGHVNALNVDYFQYLDALIDTLVAHELIPVYQPLFHGYGWKGGPVVGPVVPTDEYRRYCRYLVARYGARPAVYLLGGDGPGYFPQIGVAGEEVERWDAYGQPTGLHYCPHADNKAYQDADWLDFQWCQTGHSGEHIQERVMDMWRNVPPKAVANGEPTYEHMGEAGRAAGWWQGHEAWANLCAGGTMGVVYGAGSLWQWKLHRDEPGHQAWCSAPDAGWREALEFEGSIYVGLISKIFADSPFTDMKPNWDATYGRRGLVVPGKLLVLYLANGGNTNIISDTVPQNYRVYDPRTAEIVHTGSWTPENPTIETTRGQPRVVVFS